MSYVTRTLSNDEEIKKIIHLHWINYIFTAFLSLVTALFLLTYLLDKNFQHNPVANIMTTIFVMWTLYDFLKIYTTERVITNKRVIYKKGIISIRTEELKNSKIESVEIKQSIIGRILGYGNICFSGTGTSKVDFQKVSSPAEIKKRIEEIIGD